MNKLDRAISYKFSPSKMVNFCLGKDTPSRRVTKFFDVMAKTPIEIPSLRIYPSMEYVNPVETILALTEGSKLDANLTGGLPPNELVLKIDKGLTEIGNRLLEKGEAIGQYSTPQGYLPLRKAVLPLLHERTIQNVIPDDVIIGTGGSTELLYVLAKFGLPKEGDYAVIDGPSYPGGIDVMWNRNPTFMQMKMDEFGTRPDYLRSVFDQALHDPNHPHVFWYALFTGHNPKGITVPHWRRQQYADLIKEYSKPEKLGERLLVAEDDTYTDISYSGNPPSTLRGILEQMDPQGDKKLLDHIAYISTFSKTLNPGTRLAMAIVPKRLQEKFLREQNRIYVYPAPLVQAEAAEFIESGELTKHLEYARNVYKSRRDAAVEELMKYADKAGWKWTTPEHGFVIELTVPINATELITRMLKEKKIALLPTKGFYVVPESTPEQDNTIRLVFSFEDPEKIRWAIGETSQMIQDMKNNEKP